MVSQAKVVSLSSVPGSGARRKHAVPPILHSVRQRTKKQLAELLQGLFNNTDDALFEMADRSRSDADQHMYFESMRQIRLHRKDIARYFMEAYYKGFDALFEAEPETETIEDFDTAVDNITLVQNDELEISMAVAGIVSKVTSQFSLPIMQLTKRIDYLCKHDSVTERMNPMGPERLSNAFVEALEDLDVDIKVRIILLKLFERFVMERLGDLFKEANLMLAEAGVLPDLKNQLLRQGRNPGGQRRSPRNDPQGDGAAGTGAYGASSSSGDRQSWGGGAEAQPQTGSRGAAASSAMGQGAGGYGSTDFDDDALSMPEFDVIQGLLQRARGGGGSGTVGDGPIISTDDLVTAFSAAQAELDASITLDQVPPLLDLRQVAVSRGAKVVGSTSVSMGQADDDAVNFVGMLFDYILNDKNLAIPMKALIGRLQIPIVKLAVIDKSFFNRTSHPARQLLNELSSAGIGWSSAAELKRDALYNKIESIVLRVMNGYADDPQIVRTLLEELREFLGGDRQKNELVEQRVKESETGKARTQQAKQQVQQLINSKACGMRLPASVGTFVSKTWSKVLVYACVTEGDQSETWQARVQTLDDLLWSLQPLDNMTDVDRRDRQSVDLLARVREGMHDIQLPEGTAQELIDDLNEQLTAVSRNDRAYLEDDAPAPDNADFEQLEEIVLTAPVVDEPPAGEPTPEPEFLERIRALSEGVWVEMREEDGNLMRCKLATVVEPGSRYVFVNRRGMKVAEKTRMGLAVALKNNTLTVLDESQVFDRALQAVIGNLRQMHRSSKTAT